MSTVLGLLAVAGVLAVLFAATRVVLRLARGSVEAFIARELESTRAGRGDLSGLSQAQEWRATMRRARRWHTVHVLAWLGLLIAPLFTPWTRELYASYSVLWLLPRRRPPSTTVPTPTP
jgi:hypothetical protein